MVYHKGQAITKKILECKNNSKQLFSVVTNITNNKLSNPLPENKTDKELGNNFADFFIEKYKKIQDQFTNIEEFQL